MIEIKLTFSSVAEAAAFLAGKSAPGNAPAATSSTSGPSAPPASSKKPAASPKPTAETPPADDEPKGIDYDTEVKPLVGKVAALGADVGGGRDAVVALLNEYKAAKGSDVKAADLPAFKAALEAIIAGAEVAS